MQRLLACLFLSLGATACLGPGRPSVAATAGLYRNHEPGLASGAPLLVVPGAAWMEADLEGFLPGRSKLFYDLRGRGRSRPIPRTRGVTLESDVADLETLRREHGAERIDLMGWGYAGGVALAYALAHPERVGRLLLISPLPPRREPYWSRFQERYAERVDREAVAALDHWRASGRKQEDPQGYARAYTRVSLATFCVDPGRADQVRSRPFGSESPDPERIGRVNEAVFRRLGPWVLDRGALSRLACPVLLVHGRDDLLPFEASAEYAELLPDARLEVLDDCGRLPWIERAADFRALAEDFFRVAPSGGASAP